MVDISNGRLFILQLFVSAVLIILGSLRSVESHTATVILGAATTIIVGCIAFLKGQGQPHRSWRKTVGLREVLWQAQSIHWDLEAGQDAKVEDIKILRKSYDDVVHTNRGSRPEFWKSIGEPPAANRDKSREESSNRVAKKDQLLKAKVDTET